MNQALLTFAVPITHALVLRRDLADPISAARSRPIWNVLDMTRGGRASSEPIPAGSYD